MLPSSAHVIGQERKSIMNTAHVHIALHNRDKLELTIYAYRNNHDNNLNIPPAKAEQASNIDNDKMYM